MHALALALGLAMAASTPTYVALGDSTGVGVGARHGGYPARLARRLEAHGRKLHVVNLCVSGAGVSDVLGGQLERALAASPAVVTLGVGINDVTHGTDLDAFERDYDAVASALARAGAPVVVVNVPDLSRSPLAVGEETRRALRERVEAVNARIAAAAGRYGLLLVDLHAYAELEARPELLAADRFHPSDLGYERWTDAMQPALERALHGAGDKGGPGLSRGRPVR